MSAKSLVMEATFRTFFTKYGSLEFANIDFANITKASFENFFSKSGMIENLVVGDQTITGELVGVTISGDLIKGNTVGSRMTCYSRRGWFIL